MVFEEEVRIFKKLSNEKYCVLVFLVLFDNVLYVKDIKCDKFFKEKFEYVLGLCGMDLIILFFFIGDIFDFFDGFFVKKIGNLF